MNVIITPYLPYAVMVCKETTLRTTNEDEEELFDFQSFVKQFVIVVRSMPAALKLWRNV